MKTVESSLFDNPKEKVGTGLSARTATLSMCVHSPGLFCLVEGEKWAKGGAELTRIFVRLFPPPAEL